MGSGGIRWDQEASDGIRGHQMEWGINGFFVVITEVDLQGI